MPHLGETLALLAAVTWAISVVLFKRSGASVSAQGLNLFKNVLGLALFALTMPALGLSIDVDRSAADWGRLVVSGVLGISIADTVFFVALQRLGAARMAVIECAYSPLVIALGVSFLGEPLASSLLVGAPLVVVGVTLASLPERESAVLEPTGGTAFGVTAVVCMAAAIVLVKPALERGHLVEVTLVRLAAGVLGQLLWIAARPSERHAIEAFRPQRTWRTLIPASILSTYVAMLFWIGGFKWADASTAAVLNQCSTVFIILLSRVLLGEMLSVRRSIGAAVALAGVVVVVLG